MIKVIIADDEEKVCQLLCNLADWDALDMQVVGLAHDGLEALDLVGALCPDLMITDIRMPGCDGLELIFRAKQLNPEMEFIIISGYRHFEYAQDALRNGVSDYLLKPVKRAELNSTLEKMRARYLSRTERLSQEQQLRLRQQNDTGKLRAGLFSDLLLNERTMGFEDLQRLNASYHYKMVLGCFQIIGVKVDCDAALFSSGGFKIIEEKLAHIFCAALRRECAELEFCFQGSRAWGLLNYLPENKDAVRRQIKAALDEFLIQRDFLQGEYTVGLGGIGESPAGLPASFSGARSALDERFVQGSGRLLEAPSASTHPETGTLLADASRELRGALELLNPSAVRDAMDNLRRGCTEIDGISGGELKNLASQACATYLLLGRHLHYELPDAGTLADRFEFLADLCSSADALWNCAKTLLMDSMTTFCEQKRQADTRPIRAAKQYILENFASPLTLEQVSGFVGFNASYFSALFKKETGQNFMEYLLETRMNRAKELLRETEFSVAKICELVGYADIKHFTKSFKNATGLKPSEFRKLYS